MKTALPWKKRVRMWTADMVRLCRRILPPAQNVFRVLLYHSITDGPAHNDREEETTPRDLFKRQMQYLADNRYTVIEAAEAVRYIREKRPLPAKSVALAFDDGYKDFYTNALPVLKRHKFRAVLFPGIDLLRDYSGDKRYLSRKEIKSIKKTGLVDFGCHGLRHRALSAVSETELDEEITGAKTELEDLTRAQISLFAYPFGHSRSYNKKAIDKLKAAGYSASFTTISGANHPDKDMFLLNRNCISWVDELDEFRKHLDGAYDWSILFECVRRKRYR